jgi:hypothetical protein
MRYNNLTIKRVINESDATSKESAMSIITVITGDKSDSHLVNEHGSMIAALNEQMKNKLLGQGIKERVVKVKETK